MNRRAIIRFGALTALGALSGKLGSRALAQQKIAFKASDVHPEGYPTVAAVESLGKKLETATNGRLSVQMYAAMQLGGEKEAIEQYIESKRNQPELTGRAEAMLEEIERDAAARRQALATLFGPSEAAPEAIEETETNSEPEAPTPLRRSRGKEGEQSNS